MSEADDAVANSISFEAVKDGCQQQQSGQWKLTLKMHPDQVSQALMLAAPGQRFMCVLVALGDDEKAVDPKNIKKVNRGQMRPCNHAGMMIKNPVFQKWVVGELLPKWKGEIDTELANHIIKQYCGIESKRTLDSSADARDRWETLYGQFADENGYRATEQ